MSRQSQDIDIQSKLRPRANTASFSSFAWRKQKDVISAPSVTSVSPHSLPLEDLIQALTPPAVPSLSYARALASVLATHSPIPRRATLNPILASLCDADSPVAVQATGYDILAAYCENHEAPPLSTAERLSYFALFRGSTKAWAVELWEPRFKALRALTKYGTDIIGIELEFLEVLKLWIEGGFQGLLRTEGVTERTERAERERSVDILVKFLADVLGKAETIARISEEHLAGILHFYAGLVDRSILFRNKARYLARHSPSSNLPSVTSTPSKSSATSHRRHPSSISSNSFISPAAPSPASPSQSKQPADLAISIYLDHLSSCLRTLSATYLDSILPLLFRALAFCSSPLPRLSVLPHPAKKASSEDKITETLNALFSGPYTSTCMRILKKDLFPPTNATDHTGPHDETLAVSDVVLSAIQTSLGAHRTFRNYVRRALAIRLARAYILRETSLGYSPSGAPGNLNMERDLMERAWPKEDYTSSALGLGRNGWDAARLGRVLTKSVEAWVWWQVYEGDIEVLEKAREGKEDILDEAAGVLKDIWQELDSQGDEEKGELDEEEACVIGETLEKLVEYILPLRNQDGTPFILPLCETPTLPSPLLRSLSALLSRDHITLTNPLLSNILIHMADNLTDADTAELPRIMTEQHDLYPTSPDWLKNWQSLLKNRSLVSPQRPLTARAVMDALDAVYESVRDMKAYREPLAELVLELCQRSLEERDDRDTSHVAWKIIGDEVVLRTVESGGDPDDNTVSNYIDLLVAATSEADNDEEEDVCDTLSLRTVDQSPSPSVPSQSTVVSPTLSRTQSEHPILVRERGGEKDSALPSVMSLLSSLTTGHSSRSQLLSAQISDDATDELPPPPPLSEPLPPLRHSRIVAAVSAFITIFSQMAFTPFALEEKNVALAMRTFEILVRIAAEGRSTRARLTALQFLMRLRADRCHRLYFTHATPTHVVMLSSLIHRLWAGSAPFAAEQKPSNDLPPSNGFRSSRERDGRQISRGRTAGGTNSRTGTASRSRSRATTVLPNTPGPGPGPKNPMPLWHVYEILPFTVGEADPSEGLVTYDPDGPQKRLILPISSYLRTIVGILENETNWEILSYVLCRFPVQLANKHLFCGPNSRPLVSKMLSVMCTGILSNAMASHLVAPWPQGRIKARDAHGLAYHTLSVLVSYRRCFDLKQCHLLVEVFRNGLTSGQIPAMKCCLHALSLSAFELPSSVTKYLPSILELLSQIMSNANMAVHILAFLDMVVSLPPLYANFTENDFKVVFGVALQYLQHYNRPDSPAVSWALSQHMRIIAYAVLYAWFLALKLPDRSRHIPYITRQLLLANEGKDEVDDPTEVCFDWLSRYTYSSADPRPAPSVFNDVVMNKSPASSQETVREKTWIVGHTIITIRSVPKRGWVEVLSRRPSGYSKFLCRAENVPMVGAGDVDPDLISIPATLMVERNPPVAISSDRENVEGSASQEDQEVDIRFVFEAKDNEDGEPPPRPHPITGYVWSGTAPSQRRKEVIIDPSYFALQLSGYPERPDSYPARVVLDSALVTKFVGTLDRIPVIDTHKVGIMYVAPGQSDEVEILRNTHGSPAYTRFLEGLGRLINLRGQVDVYAGGLDPDEDGEYAYAWWDDIGQILYHTATMMPTTEYDPNCNNKKRHIGNDYVRIVWNDSGLPYRFDTLSTQFQFVNIIIEPHSLGSIAAFSNQVHENEYFKVTIQRATGMPEFAPVGHFKLISAESLPAFVRQLSQLADWFASVFANTQRDTERVEMKTNWRMRLEYIRRFKNQFPAPEKLDPGEETFKDFTTIF